MKKLLIAILVILIFGFILAKTPSKLGFRGGTDYFINSDVSHDPFNPHNYGMELYFGYPLTNYSFLKLSAGYDRLKLMQNIPTNNVFSPGFYGEFYVPTNLFFKPYLDLGTRLGIYSQNNNMNYSFMSSLGLGLEAPISDRVSLNISSRWNYPAKDNFDRASGGRYNDSYVDIKVGMAYHFGSIKVKKIFSQEEVLDTISTYKSRVRSEKSSKEEISQVNEQLRTELSKTKKVCKGKIDSLKNIIQQKNEVIASLRRELEASVLDSQKYMIKPGDWLSKISQEYYDNIDKWEKIYSWNKEKIGDNPDVIQPFREIILKNVPQKNANPLDYNFYKYTVKSGESLISIAKKEYGNPYAWIIILKDNADVIGQNINMLMVGTVLNLRTKLVN